MRPRDITTTTGTREDRRLSRRAAQRSSLPTTLPRPVKVTRDLTYTVPPAHVRELGVEMEDHERDGIARKLGTKLGKFASSIQRVTVRVVRRSLRRRPLKALHHRASGPAIGRAS